jgi:CHRD domain-containing protein
MKRFAFLALVALAAVAVVATVATGQNRSVNFKTTLTGAAEVPGPGDPDGIGTAKVKIKSGTEICFSIKARHITLPAAAAHIHVGSRTVAGPVVVTLAPPDASGKAKGCVAHLDPALVSAIVHNPDQYYVNVHTSDFPDGAIRGQLG